MCDLICSGTPAPLNLRQRENLNKEILRQLFRPLSESDLQPQHEIANHYKDVKRGKALKYRRKSKRQSYAPRKFSPPIREILKIPKLVFPR